MNVRTHGGEPFEVAVIHGGPGAGGEMAPVARALAGRRGVLEPIQTAASLQGQVDELEAVLARHGRLPVTLIGFSWGEWLSFIVAARSPSTVRKLILVSSGPFEEKYVSRITEMRLGRLTAPGERHEFSSLMRAVESSPSSEIMDNDLVLARLGALTSRTDSFDPIPTSAEPDGAEPVRARGDVFERVWSEAAELRRSGELLALGRNIRCPVVAIQGDYDPHPAEGVQEPLSRTLKHFRLVTLKDCGHTPWCERQAREEFYRVLERELH